jgi:hypothetical protein
LVKYLLLKETQAAPVNLEAKAVRVVAVELMALELLLQQLPVALVALG